ncbi:hypothetical protein GCM10027194_08020 [Thalassiella azotivora]
MRVVLLEVLGLPGAHGELVAAAVAELLGVGEDLPDGAAEHLVAGAVEDALALGVEVGDGPVPVEGVEAGGHRLQHGDGLVLAGPDGGHVVPGADQPQR